MGLHPHGDISALPTKRVTIAIDVASCIMHNVYVLGSVKDPTYYPITVLTVMVSVLPVSEPTFGCIHRYLQGI